MSRVEFRIGVDLPRPVSAWIMTSVASAALWITGELSLWVIAIQIGFYAFTFATRKSPPTWCRNALVLNTGMLWITGLTIVMALRGHPATLSLAHFAALSQALQLLDARPRKSEFLLVALSLFQVVLAANLTDSILFPPLLVAFLASVTWTLLIHTLRTEALEAGDLEGARHVVTRGLARTTAVATMLCILGALVLFTLLPRMKSGFVGGGLGAPLAMAGFSDEVELGTIGRIRQNDTVVLRVETLQGDPVPAEEAYWRGLAFDRFDGRRWAISPFGAGYGRELLNGHARFGLNVRGAPPADAVVQRIVREPVEAGVIFAAGPIRRLEGPLARLELDTNGGVYDPGQTDQRVRYTVWSEPAPPDIRALRSDTAAPPPEIGPRAAQRSARYLELPDLDPAVAELAAGIAAGAESDAERAAAIERHLREHGRYTDSPPDMTAHGARSPIEGFVLGDLAGHCEYFASAMVVLARTQGLPARLVNGFAGGRTNEMGGFTEVTQSDAHAWVEIHYRDAGWVRYDPTPPDLRLRAVGPLSFAESLSEIASAIELWWFQRIVDFDSSDQILALKAAFVFVRDLWPGGEKRVGPVARDTSDPAPTSGSHGGPRTGDLLWLAPLLLAMVGGGVWIGRRLQRRPDDPRLPDDYRKALRWLARRGHPRPPESTARDFVKHLEESLDPAVAKAFSPITERYLAVRFGGDAGAAEAVGVAGHSELDRLQQALKTACPTSLERAVALVGLGNHAHVVQD